MFKSRIVERAQATVSRNFQFFQTSSKHMILAKRLTSINFTAELYLPTTRLSQLKNYLHPSQLFKYSKYRVNIVVQYLSLRYDGKPARVNGISKKLISTNFFSKFSKNSSSIQRY